MKNIPVLFVVLTGLLVGSFDGLAQKAEDNRGVLNGPLTDTRLGLGNKEDGSYESVKLAIEDLIKTYGPKYPKGPEFLKRLEDPECKRRGSAKRKALQRDALLIHNPAIDFDKILLVKASRNTKRFSGNWKTRTSCADVGKPYGGRELNMTLNKLMNDPSLKELKAASDRSRKDYEEVRGELLKSDAWKKEKNHRKRQEMEKALPEYKPYKDELDVLSEAARKLPGYLEMEQKVKNKAINFSFNDELVTLSMKGDGEMITVFKPERGFIGDVDLHWDGDRILFAGFRDINKLSKVNGKGKGYGVFEVKIDPKSGKASGPARVVSPDMGSDVDCYDACYLPDGRIIFASTASYEGVPCVGGNEFVANLFLMNDDGSKVRRLTFDQDASWHPSVMENGRVMYTRWEYTDSAHYFSRIVMTMNPDGTDQKAFYGSNSYWPNSMFFPRQVPGKPTQFVAVIIGHHDNPKGGAICLFDVSKGRFEADGAVQLLTGRGRKVAPIVLDDLGRSYWRKFYNPYPINDKYFLATDKSGSLFMLDVFDNVIPLAKSKGGVTYYEPFPLRKTKKPFVRPDSVKLGQEDAAVLINDIYAGPGIKGVPHGTVKSLRVYRYEYGPRQKGGHYAMGMEAGWDAKQILGTATIEDDGSASFKVPANTPFAMQPLDKEGRALALMRSWTVAMPGETLSCVGCHESQNMTPPIRRAKAMLRKPEELKPFYGPLRGFSFIREIQPILDKYCISCHDGAKDTKGLEAKGIMVADRVVGTGKNTGKKFSEVGIPNLTNEKASKYSHDSLHPFVRRNGPEGDYHLLTPLEFHAGTSELTQMLKKGHHNVKLDEDSWKKLYAWMDLNAPLYGTWTEAGASKKILERRIELRKIYASVSYNPETIVNPYTKSDEVVAPEPLEVKVVKPQAPKVSGYEPKSIVFDLGDDVTMKFVSIPAGEFSMGSNDESPDEQPIARVKIKKPFMMGATEVTLEQYRQFEKDYLNGVYDMHYKDQVHRGYYMNNMKFPVIRVSWKKAMAFCGWLSEKMERKVSLPTEAQWEWACRAGTATPLSYGDVNADFSEHANVADLTIREMAVKGINPKPIRNPGPPFDFELKDPRYNDKVLHLARAGSFKANAWGLHDMHGNAAEWTRSAYQPYPYKDDARNDLKAGIKRVVRGGSWHDRPFRATSSYRLGYPDWQRVYHTGFRVIIEE